MVTSFACDVWKGIWILLASASLANAAQHVTPTPMDVRCNAHGAIVTIEGGPVLYLGKTCDAVQEGGGQGKWWWAASGFAVEIDGQATLYHNDLDCPVPFCNVDGLPD